MNHMSVPKAYTFTLPNFEVTWLKTMISYLGR